TSLTARGKSRRPGLLGREPMASLLATRRKHLAAALRLHARAEAVRLRATPLTRLIGSLWQSNPPLCPALSYVPGSRTISLSLRERRTARPSRQPSTGHVSSLFRISKCSRRLLTRSRNRVPTLLSFLAIANLAHYCYTRLNFSPRRSAKMPLRFR